MPPKLFVHFRCYDSGSTDHLHLFGVPTDLPIETTFLGVKERIHSAGGPLPSFQRLELEFKTRYLDETGDCYLHRRTLYITLKDNETFLPNPFVNKELMNIRVPCVTFVVKTFEGDPHGENVAEQLFIFRNHDISSYNESDQDYFNFLLKEYQDNDKD
jgi:hypothetical protein